MTKLLKYLKGYLRIRVWGLSPERFMNLCSKRDILLWDIVREEESYYMCISLKSFWKLRDIVRKTGTRVVICSRYGLPFFVPVMLARKVFWLGLFLAVAFWIWSSFYIWDIELSGNYRITEDRFIAFLRKEDVSIGMRKETLDIEDLERAIRREFAEITWTSAKLSGTKLEIAVKESDAPMVLPPKDSTIGKDLVAQHSGTIVSLLIRKGIPMVEVGQPVEVGTVLVDGKVPVYGEDGLVRKYTLVQADADILMEREETFRDTLPFSYLAKDYTGRTGNRYFLQWGSREWKTPDVSTFLKQDSIIKAGRPVVFEKLSIPIYWGVEEIREYQEVEYDYTLEQAEYELYQKLKAFYVTLEEKGVQIIEKDVKIDTNSDQWVIEGRFLIREPAGVLTETKRPDEGETKAE